MVMQQRAYLGRDGANVRTNGRRSGPLSGRRNDRANRVMREVLFEMTAIGNSVKVCAVDPVSGTEVALIGPVSAGEEALKLSAMRKLDYVMNKQKEQRAAQQRGIVT